MPDEAENKTGMIAGLVEDYGWKLLVMLSFIQHGVKGFVYGLTLPGIDFVLKMYQTSGPDIQIYKAFILLPWGMKPLVGLLSDYMPIFGYRKIPYMVFSLAVGVVGLGYVGFSPIPYVGIRTVVVGLFCVFFAVASCDLLSEAKYSEQLRAHPERGPDLMTFVWGGIIVIGLVSTLLLGPLIHNFGAQSLYSLCIVPMAIVLVPLFLNYLGDDKLSDAEIAVTRSKVFTQPEMVFLTGVVACAVIAISIASLSDLPKKTCAIIALVMAVITIGSFLMLLSPIVGKMNAFAVLQTFCAISIDGATFYFFTDNAEQFPGGPNFSTWFYTTGLGTLVAVTNLIGLWSYNRWMKKWNYRSIFIFSNILVSCVHMWGILIYSRTNLSMGIPDDVFALTTAAMYSITHQWMWMPGILLLGQLCPKGSEATMYALLAGCHNLGNSGANMLGAYALEYFGVTPSGRRDEGHFFANLWKVALLASILPTLTMFMIPICIPNASQTDRLLPEDCQSATEGSPWRTLRKRWGFSDARDVSGEERPLTSA